jgi:predicted DCC family thiol-disulfide oxidoreductase YuxK
MGRLFGELERIAAHASPGRLAVLYDGGCEMCRNVAAGVLRYDNTDALELLDANEPAARALFPELKLDDLLYELHVIDDRGRVYRGARAVNEILRRQTGLRSLVAYLWYFPGYAWLADRQYKAIAGRRYRFGAAGKTDAAVGTSAARQR